VAQMTDVAVRSGGFSSPTAARGRFSLLLESGQEDAENYAPLAALGRPVDDPRLDRGSHFTEELPVLVVCNPHCGRLVAKSVP
jgi:hypothetical protein